MKSIMKALQDTLKLVNNLHKYGKKEDARRERELKQLKAQLKKAHRK
jgi:hypothetical protein